MQIKAIDIESKKGMKTQYELESNQMIKMPSAKKVEGKTVRVGTKKPSDFRGAISRESGKKLQEQIKRSRKAWE